MNYSLGVYGSDSLDLMRHCDITNYRLIDNITANEKDTLQLVLYKNVIRRLVCEEEIEYQGIHAIQVVYDFCILYSANQLK